MGKITYICGGARSGKSTFALSIAKKQKGKIAFIATCEPKDREMKERIVLHKASRPKCWQTFEEPRDITSVLNKIGPKFKTIIIDCVTLWITNLMVKNNKNTSVETKMKIILNTIKRIDADCIIVTNEVGLGIVPNNKMAREFRDISGRINQMIAQRSVTAYFMASGIPWRIK